MRQFIFILWVVASSVLPTAAGAQFSDSFSSRLGGFSTSVEEINGRTNDWKNKKIPDRLSEIFVEQGAAEKEINEVKDSKRSLSLRKRFSEAAKQLPSDVSKFRNVVENFKSINCPSPQGRALLSEFKDLHESIDGNVSGISPISENESLTCESVKSTLSALPDAWIDRWVGDDARKGDVKDTVDYGSIEAAYTGLEAELKKRVTTLKDKSDEMEQRQSLTGNFIWFILLFGGLSLGAMALVTLFPEHLQSEWVVSGQVTQFVTVMILLTVITMLGLSKTINAETLGTLLGGVAGYVLAQGVGKAAARDATRAVRDISRGSNGKP